MALNGDLTTEDRETLLQAAAKRIQKIANDLLLKNTERIASEYNILPIIEQIIAEKKLQANSNIIFIFEKNFAENELLAVVEPTELGRILSNLIDNSLQSLNESSSILVRIKKQNNFAYIEVEDKGRGIPKSVLPMIGIKGFSHGKSGNGLGLYHALTTIETWGGKMEISSTENVGTKVSIEMNSHA